MGGSSFEKRANARKKARPWYATARGQEEESLEGLPCGVFFMFLLCPSTPFQYFTRKPDDSDKEETIYSTCGNILSTFWNFLNGLYFALVAVSLFGFAVWFVKLSAWILSEPATENHEDCSLSTLSTLMLWYGIVLAVLAGVLYVAILFCGGMCCPIDWIRFLKGTVLLEDVPKRLPDKNCIIHCLGLLSLICGCLSGIVAPIFLVPLFVASVMLGILVNVYAYWGCDVSPYAAPYWNDIWISLMCSEVVFGILFVLAIGLLLSSYPFGKCLKTFEKEPKEEVEESEELSSDAVVVEELDL